MTSRRSTILRYVLFNKPFGVLSQFTGEPGLITLRHFGPFPPDVYPVGRLDADSEGLLLLTNDTALQHRLSTPAFGHPRTYLVQVERIPSDDSLRKLREGVPVEGRQTRPAAVQLLTGEPDLPPRPVPIRFRKSVPTCWIELTLVEGRNRQVRKMTAAVGHPTLRLVRSKLGFLGWGDLKPGDKRDLTEVEVQQLRAAVRLK